MSETTPIPDAVLREVAERGDVYCALVEAAGPSETAAVLLARELLALRAWARHFLSPGTYYGAFTALADTVVCGQCGVEGKDIDSVIHEDDCTVPLLRALLPKE